MLAARWTILILAAVLILTALGATSTEIQPSAQRVAVTAVVGLLAPLFWPGRAATLARTALRVAAWSFAAACLAAIMLRVVGSPGQPIVRILAACAMLLPVLIVTHAVAAGLEARLLDRSWDAQAASETAGRMTAIALVFLGSAPLWLGPVAELLVSGQAWITDAIVGLSPLTHLAVASGNDLLRNQWFYQHSNLAALQYSYPGLAEIFLAYASVALLLALYVLSSLRRRLSVDGTRPTTQSKLEKAK